MYVVVKVPLAGSKAELRDPPRHALTFKMRASAPVDPTKSKVKGGVDTASSLNSTKIRPTVNTTGRPRRAAGLRQTLTADEAPWTPTPCRRCFISTEPCT